VTEPAFCILSPFFFSLAGSSFFGMALCLHRHFLLFGSVCTLEFDLNTVTLHLFPGRVAMWTCQVSTLSLDSSSWFDLVRHVRASRVSPNADL
jgi:hypothetical protein